MGWTYTQAKFWKKGKVDRKAECDSLLTWGEQTVLKSSMVGTTYYAAVKRGDNVWGAIFLTATDGFDFGYKDMDETCMPYYFDCPVSILNLLTPTDNEYANKWRNACREKRAKAKETDLSKMPIGTRIRITMPFSTQRIAEGKVVELIKLQRGYRSTYWVCQSYGCYFSRGLMRSLQQSGKFEVVNGEA